MKTYGKYAKKAYRKRARRPRSRPYAKRTTTIARVVKKVLSRNLEKKAFFFASANIGMTTASTTVAPLVSNLIPNLVQGTGHSQRIGNEVKVSKAYIRGLINIREYNATTNPLPVPIWVKMWLVSSKISNQPAFTVASTYSTFFDSNNTAIGFQSNVLDIILTPNQDAWTVHSTKTIKLGSGSQSANNAPVGGTSYFDNSPMSVPFYFNIAKHIDKLKFDDTVNNLCTNRNLMLIYQCVNADGQTSTYTPCEIHTSHRVEYTDA